MGSSLWQVAEVRLAYAVGTLFALAAVLVRMHVGAVAGLVAYAGACGVAALLLPPRLAVVVGLSAWGFFTGFVVNAGGRLTFAASDVRHLALLLVLPLAVALLAPGHGSRV